MPHTHRHHDHYRRRSSRPPVKFWFILVGVLALGALAAFTLMSPGVDSGACGHSIWQSALALTTNSGRQVDAPNQKGQIFPYSIVAGGVHNKQQFDEAMRTDPVAAAHYSNFNAAKFHLVKLQHAEEAYVSFRVGDNVYWTSHKVTLRKGETLISDGGRLGRTRCGNRVSETPRLPIYNHEPSAKELDTAAQPKVETAAFTAESPIVPGPIALPITALIPNHPLLPGPGPRRLASTSPHIYTPFAGTPLYPSPPDGCPKGATNSNGKCGTPNTPDTPNSPAPENNAWILFLTGGGLLAAYGLIRRRRGEMV
ncbi:MAG: hypothetical protein ACRD18_00460 [Terriglobia bacterium]